MDDTNTINTVDTVIQTPTEQVVTKEDKFDSTELGSTFVEKRDNALEELRKLEEQKNNLQNSIESMISVKMIIVPQLTEIVKKLLDDVLAAGIQIGSQREELKKIQIDFDYNQQQIAQQQQQLSTLTTIVPQIESLLSETKELIASSSDTLKSVSVEFPNFISSIKNSVSDILEMGELARQTMHYTRDDMMSIERSQNERNDILNKREEQLNVRELAIETMYKQLTENQDINKQ